MVSQFSKVVVLLIKKVVVGLFVSGLLATSAMAQSAFNHNHSEFDALLKKHVSWNAAGTASTVNYKGFAVDRSALKTVIDQYGGVTKAQFDGFKRDEKMAYLINVYNANTIELILTKYPDLKSIKDLGGVFKKPWSINFIKLLGEEKNLDHVEHGLLRAKGVYDEPRVHFLVNCASIGCPALLPEAITAAKLETQLEDGTRRFLRDKTRNVFNAQSGKLEVSKIFDWFKEDWTRGTRGITSREVFFSRYADLLSDNPAAQAKIKEGKVDLAFKDYDWNLNDNKNPR